MKGLTLLRAEGPEEDVVADTTDSKAAQWL